VHDQFSMQILTSSSFVKFFTSLNSPSMSSHVLDDNVSPSSIDTESSKLITTYSNSSLKPRKTPVSFIAMIFNFIFSVIVKDDHGVKAEP